MNKKIKQYFRLRISGFGLKYIFSAVFLFCCFAVAYPQTEIKGEAPAYAGKEIVLCDLEDYIIYTEKKLEAATIGEDGKFTLETDLPYTFLGILKIDDIKASLFIEPDGEYQVTFPEFTDPSGKIMSKEKFVDLVLEGNDKKELNLVVREFNEAYDDFLAAHYADFVNKNIRSKADSFIAVMKTHYASLEKDYARDYINYSLATLELAAFHSRKTLYEKYLSNKPVKYRNSGYMSFFNQFYEGHFKQVYFAYEKEIKDAINLEQSFKKLDEVLQKDKYLQDKAIRELVILKGLVEMYHHPDLEQKNMLFIVKTMAKEASLKQHRIIAGNIVEKKSKLAIGSPAPGFELYDKEGNLVKLSDFKGKYLYIDFWATWCTPCLKEFPLIKEMKEKYGKQIEFISISIDENSSRMNAFLQKYPNYDWHFLHYGNQKEIMEAYGIKAVPAYYLINPDGLMILSPADRPSGDIEKVFKDIKENKGRNSAWGY